MKKLYIPGRKRHSGKRSASRNRKDKDPGGISFPRMTELRIMAKKDIKEVKKSINEEEFEKLKQDFDNLQNQLKRAVADYQNLEKRVAEGRSELTSFVATELIKKLLVVLDHYEKAISGASEQERQSGWFRGVELATQQLQQVLKDEGLEEIEIDPGSTSGTRFDPTLHEAVDMREPSDAEAMEGKGDNMILEVVEKGYNLNGKVLKPAKVVVGRSSSAKATEG